MNHEARERIEDRLQGARQDFEKLMEGEDCTRLYPWWIRDLAYLLSLLREPEHEKKARENAERYEAIGMAVEELWCRNNKRFTIVFSEKTASVRVSGSKHLNGITRRPDGLVDALGHALEHVLQVDEL